MKMYSQEIEKKLKSKSNRIKVCQYIKNETEKQKTNIVKPHFAYFLQNYILKTHWDIVRKVGCGIDHFILDKSPDHHSKCFYIVRKDGSIIDFSFHESITPRKSQQIVYDACRSAIEQQIRDMRNMYINKLPFECPITGELIKTKDDFEIDHYDSTFYNVFRMWVADKDIDELEKNTNHFDDGLCSKVCFIDTKIKNDFINFHNSHTHLRAVSKKANQSILKKNNSTENQ